MFLAKIAQAALERAQADAAAAAAREEAALVASARARLTQVLGSGAGVGELVVEEVDTSDALVVLSDAAVCLAVTNPVSEGFEVLLVVDDEGWTEVGKVDSLAGLGRVLAERAERAGD